MINGWEYRGLTNVSRNVDRYGMGNGKGMGYVDALKWFTGGN